MSLTKRMIDEYLMAGIDVLHPEFQQSDDEYQYEEHCHYSGLPSPKAYGNE
jgi:hypothetical protein